MGLSKKSVRDIDARGKRVLVRCDFNVPLEEGRITDDRRITEALPTIKLLLGEGAVVILASHLGRPKGPTPEFSLAPVAARLRGSAEPMRNQLSLGACVSRISR